MKVRVAARGVELSAELKDYIERRVHFSLGRLSGKVDCLSIRLSQVSEPREGDDKCCEIRIEVRLRHSVVVRESQSNLYEAVAFAVERAERAIQRQLS